MQQGFSKRQFASVIAFAVLAFASQGSAADLSLPVTGNLLGTVVDSGGTPQMGATIQLFNKYQRLLAKTITTPDGQFAFANLPADIYSVRVLLASFLPVSRDRVAVKAGLNSVLQIHVATLFSNIELTYTVPNGGMTDDWKWVLRSSPATRPINRIFAEEMPPKRESKMRPQIFSDTRAMFTVSGGDGGAIDSDTAVSDLGTGFALSTSVLGKNQLQLAGNFGSGAQAGPVAMGLCAIYSRSESAGITAPPEVTLTIEQLGRFGTLPAGAEVAGPNTLEATLPALRTMSLSFYQTADPLDNVHLEYGMTGESVDYQQNASRISPFARVTVDIGSAGQVLAAYSDGGRPDGLTTHQGYRAVEADAPTGDLMSAVDALSRLPQISTRNGQLELQRTASYEIGYNKVIGSQTYAVSGFYENVSNGRINVAGDLSEVSPGDLLSDYGSMTASYNIGNYRRTGYLVSAAQRVNDSVDVTIAYGRMGGFTANAGGLAQSSGVQEKFLSEGGHNLASANVRVRTPVTGTRLLASYGWMDPGAVIPTHAFTTQWAYVSPGLNVVVRQPLPSFFGMPGHLELTADLRNLLAQGYIPLATNPGEHMLIVQAPRAIRGGLSFIF